MKFILPLIWFFSFIKLISLFFNVQPSYSDLPKEFIILFWFFGLFIIYWFYFRLKKVSVFGDFLYVSNFLKEIQIPLTEVEKVTENVWLNHNPVTIHLKHSSEFGKKIVFMPTIRFFTFYSSHPIVGELKELIRSKNYELKSNYRY